MAKLLKKEIKEIKEKELNEWLDKQEWRRKFFGDPFKDRKSDKSLFWFNPELENGLEDDYSEESFPDEDN